MEPTDIARFKGVAAIIEVCCPKCGRVGIRDRYVPRFGISQRGRVTINGVDVWYRCSSARCRYVFDEGCAILANLLRWRRQQFTPSIETRGLLGRVYPCRSAFLRESNRGKP